MNQDFIAWVGQGDIADRDLEHLGESDRGIIMVRKKMMEQAQLVADGGEPKAVIRDPERNKNLPIRSAERNETATGHIEAGARDLTGLLKEQDPNADGGAEFLLRPRRQGPAQPPPLRPAAVDPRRDGRAVGGAPAKLEPCEGVIDVSSND